MISKIVASFFGIGYVGNGGGSLAALLFLPCYYYFSRFFYIEFYAPLLLLLIILVLGFWSSEAVEKDWGNDNQKVVIDEVAGMCISLVFIPLDWVYFGIAFILFRLFDIYKPLYIKKIEQYPGAIGVMGDDIVAGLYAQIGIQLIILTVPLLKSI